MSARNPNAQIEISFGEKLEKIPMSALSPFTFKSEDLRGVEAWIVLVIWYITTILPLSYGLISLFSTSFGISSLRFWFLVLNMILLTLLNHHLNLSAATEKKKWDREEVKRLDGIIDRLEEMKGWKGEGRFDIELGEREEMREWFENVGREIESWGVGRGN